VFVSGSFRVSYGFVTYVMFVSLVSVVVSCGVLSTIIFAPLVRVVFLYGLLSAIVFVPLIKIVVPCGLLSTIMFVPLVGVVSCRLMPMGCIVWPLGNSSIFVSSLGKGLLDRGFVSLVFIV
jgi:hypothetical protein